MNHIIEVIHRTEKEMKNHCRREDMSQGISFFSEEDYENKKKTKKQATSKGYCYP